MRILIIEDEPRICLYIKKGLELKSCIVDVAHTSDEGFDLALDSTYNAIVLDRMLTGSMDGLELCQKLRADNITTPILMLTAKGEPGDRIEGLEAGADDYLAKPFVFAELVARLRAITRREKQSYAAVLKVGDLSLNPDTMTVYRNQHEIKLTKMEYALLDFFLRHPKHIFTKEQLLEYVWPYDTDALPNTVQVYLGYLRKKIEEPFPHLPPVIQTVRGFGYKIG